MSMTKMTLASILVALATGVAAYGGYMFLSRDSAGLLNADNAQVTAKGKAIYAQQCASCHGQNLEGQPDWQTRDEEGFLPAPPHDRNGHTWHHPDRLLFDITKLGLARAANLKDYRTRMPAFDGVLSDEEIIAALSYIKSTWPVEFQKRHDELNRVHERRKRLAP
jgi:mono/diheme cytochrome c family protein